MRKFINKKAFTLVEIMVSTACTLALILAVYNFYNLTKQVYTSVLSRQTLQDGANIVLSKIIEGGTEPTGVFRLAQGASYCIGSGLSCGTINASELHFWGTDSIERWYFLDNARTSLMYHHPTAANPAGADERVYAAPKGSILTLLFWIPTGNYPAADVGVNVALTQNTITGSVTTQINLRNHP